MKKYIKKGNLDLENTIKKTLNNNICKSQSLDKAADRNRVLKELMKTLKNLFYTAKEWEEKINKIFEKDNKRTKKIKKDIEKIKNKYNII